MQDLRPNIQQSGSAFKALRAQPLAHRLKRALAMPGGAAALLCLGLGLVALALRLYRLEAQSLWLDEGSSWELSRASWGVLLSDLLSPSAAYPLYHLLLKGWMALFGDSEAALRMPSALAGALAVPVLYLAAVELERYGAEEIRRHGDTKTRRHGDTETRRHGDTETRRRLSAPIGSPGLPISRSPGLPVSLSPTLPLSPYGLAAALIGLASPYAIWYSQEAKVYSLLLLSSALLVWALARALRRDHWRDWVLLAALGLLALLVHRLSALLLVAGFWAWAVRRLQLATAKAETQKLQALIRIALAALLSLGLVAALVGGLGGEQAAGRAEAGAAIPAGPGLALGLTFVRFSVDRWPGDGPWWWLLPWALLTAWGLARALSDMRRPATRARATLLLLLLGVPTALFLAQLSVTRLYEARYMTVIFPAWALLLAYPRAGAQGSGIGDQGSAPPVQRGGRETRSPRALRAAYSVLLAGVLATSWLALSQPVFGLFSGDPVKEQYREAITALAARVHPDDAVVLHPTYLGPLYRYYMGRLSADPAPEPIGFVNFWQGETAFGQREWDIERQARLAGYTRSWLLIAPEHARTVDRPRPGDEYGLVGLFWAYSGQQRAWPCGIWRYNGAHLLCQAAPEAYVTGAPQVPQTPVGATFGGNLTLLGYTMKATLPGRPGVFQAGGNLPLSLFWDVAAPTTQDYSLFLHLCQRCDEPPPAGEDGPPLEGYLPTSVWLPGKPARDDRAIALPHDLPPGRYTLLLGMYDPQDPSEAGRLEVTGGEQIGKGRLVLGTVEIVAADEASVANSRP